MKPERRDIRDACHVQGTQKTSNNEPFKQAMNRMDDEAGKDMRQQGSL